MATRFVALHARHSQSSGVATMFRTTPPPEGIGALEAPSEPASKRTSMFGDTPVSTNQMRPSDVAAMAHGRDQRMRAPAEAPRRSRWRPRRRTELARKGRMAARRSTPKRATRSRRWSRHVMETSDALDLEPGVFNKPSPRAVARSLKRSADRSRRRRSDPFRSAMSMLTFFINRAGRSLSAERRRVLEGAKDELRQLYDRPARQQRVRRDARR
jgi:hypothetical protein